MEKKKEYQHFIEDHTKYGAKHCNLEKSQWGLGSDPFRETHGKALETEVVHLIHGYKGRILDIGCGQAHILSLVSSEFNEAIGIDISKTRVHQSRRRLRGKGISILLCNAGELPFDRECFNLVCATEVIEHVFSDKCMLREIWRVLKLDGVLVLSTPNAWNFDRFSYLAFNLLKGRRLRLSGDFPENLLIREHIRFFNTFLLKQRLMECGFKILVMRGVGFKLPSTMCRHLPDSYPVHLFARMLNLLGRLFSIFSQTLLVVATSERMK